MVSAILATVRTRLIPSQVAHRMLKAITTHTCQGIEWDLDGPSPSEYCKVCQRSMMEYHTGCIAELATRVAPPPTPIEDIRRGEADRELATRLVDTKEVHALLDYDLEHGINRPWWFYGEMHDEKYGPGESWSEQRVREDLEKYKIEHEEAQARAEAMKRDLRAWIVVQDSRETVVRDKEFANWLATPKNKRTIIMADGKTMNGVAKADTGSVVLRNCPPEVSLADIRTIMTKFGGVRDVYRPTDRITGAPKPFVFVEMLRNNEAWAAVDYFTEVPCVLDGRCLSVSGAGERKTSTEMAKICHTVPVVQEKPIAPKIRSGAFAALADSDSE
jgi:hypothetical protein